MQNIYQPVYSLVNEIKGTTRIIHNLTSRKSGVLLLLVIVGVVASKIFLS